LGNKRWLAGGSINRAIFEIKVIGQNFWFCADLFAFPQSLWRIF
jgi:hypothetical protein